MPVLAWITLAATGTIALTVDLVWSRRTRSSDVRAALVAAVLWTVAGVAFAGAVAAFGGVATAGRYLTVFSLERVLSLDNVAVFAAVFAAIAVPAARQGRVLTGGLLGALVLRVGFIAAGLALVGAAHALLLVFGLILIGAGAGMLRQSRQSRQSRPGGDGRDTAHAPSTLRWLPDGLRQHPESMALAAVILADVAFAADSILAAFAVTTSAYPIVAANVFAVLGLRPLYVVLTHALERFRLLRPGIGVLLGLIGVELVLEPFVAVPAWVTLAVVVGCVGVAVGLSLAEERGMTLMRLARKFGVTLGGGVLLLAGVAMLVLPGPGILVIIAGLAVLATEYAWAKRPLDVMRARARRLRERVGR
jgi:tellurite resistance protein TerC